MDEVTIEGTGLHTGLPGRVTLRRRIGPVAIRVAGGDEVALADWRVVGTVRGMTIASLAGDVRIMTPDHLFAACGGLGVHADLVVDLHGPEVPLVDGCAIRFCEALRTLGFTGGPTVPKLAVRRAAVLESRGSTYTFEPGGSETEIAVAIDFGGAPVTRAWSWNGQPETFVESIASARTFAFAQEIESLMARGLAKHVDPKSVVVVHGEELLSAGRTATRDEPVRHKVLDLVGDLYLHGGPPLGRIHATRPGHGSTHDVVRRAIDEGVIGPVTR
ncbi:MAG: UDP-3-O-acyl-N-acetylglucosamine deacetylase [Polyangiaceae bacterium]